MFAPTRLYWESYPDAEKDLPRCGWSNEQWEKLFVDTWIPEMQRLWQWCKSEENIMTASHDMSCNDKIFRFACMSQKYCVKLRGYYLSKGNKIELTSHEIWESLLLSRTATTECQNWKSGSTNKIMQRVCYLVCKWNRISSNNKINNYINGYIGKYKNFDETSVFHRTTKILPQNQYIFNYDTTEFKATMVSIDGWNDISWQHSKGSGCIISPTALWLSLNLKFGVIHRCPLISGDNESPKDCTVKIFGSEAMAATYTKKELEQVLASNKANGVSIKMIHDLKCEHDTYVCICCLFFFFVCCLFFCLSILFVCGDELQNNLVSTITTKQTKLQDMSHFKEESRQLILIVPPNVTAFQDAFHPIFQLLGDFNKIVNSLRALSRFLHLEKTCLHNVNVVLKPFVACFYYDVNDPHAGRTSNRLYADLHKHLVDRTKDIWHTIFNSSIRPYVTFWLKSLWSAHYIKNGELNLKFPMVDIEWKNIPVSCYEVVMWQDDIFGLIAEYRCGEFLCDQWLKYWILKCFKNAAYEQMLQYMIDHVKLTIKKIELSM